MNIVKKKNTVVCSLNKIALIRIDAMRRGGELLRDVARYARFRTDLSALPEGTQTFTDYLSSIGLSKKDAHRWQVMVAGSHKTVRKC